MKIFIAGASGTMGHALIPQLVKAGYAVTALSRTPQKLHALKQMGATPVLGDVFDRPHLNQLVADAAPNVVIHQLTSLGNQAQDPFTETNRLRTEGTANLIHAAQRTSVQRFIAQSVAFLSQSPDGELTHEATLLYRDAPPPLRSVVEAVASLEHQVLSLTEMTGVVLRYGHFYGPGTYYANDGVITTAVRQGLYPIVDQEAGTCSFVQIEDAATATVQAITQGSAGIYTIVDDAPVLMRQWLSDYSRLLQAPAPPVLSAEMARTQLDPVSLYFATQQQGAVNQKARQVLGWQPRYSNWHVGFQAMLGAQPKHPGFSAAL
ncbi:NAD dependent epimerase/dehydratase family [Synechococcus sp. PCC 7335]|uniref:NAD-dependent epimerase/dehydratase family protein n=1 Tax=Synechococcus sp. (strain ATCC 29403 / PCC 7335) TaxID=91464 RepID=UPI00017EDD81|nr:NAD(P)-dependent oxidoreductase [Synechococcus sp. PCC 7335]EDX82739.1 NAD dependent epimerase/dehydratase family [Synechococcus sp. PCC 7335]